MNFSKGFTNLKNMLYHRYGENPGKMLVHTGTLGWILSSIAQVGAVVFNDKISQDQKKFLIPQEIADAAVNIISFYVITNSLKSFSSKLVSTGKLVSPKIKKFLDVLKIENPKARIGNWNFNIENLPDFKNIKGDYTPFKNGVDVVASTIGSIISCNLITPVLRNDYAARSQKRSLRLDKLTQEQVVKNPSSTPYSFNHTTMNDFTRISGMKI